MNGIVRRPGKTTIKAIEGLDSERIINATHRGHPQLDALMELLMGWMGASRIIKGEGAPNIFMRGYESSPGAWLYDDTETGILFVVFSDGYKKHPWKGSSIEFVLGPATLQQLPDAFERLVRHLATSSNYYGSEALERFIRG